MNSYKRQHEQALIANAKVLTTRRLAQVERNVLRRLFVKSENPVRTFKKAAMISSNSVLIFSKYSLNHRVDANADFVELFDLAAAFGLQELEDTCITVISHTICCYDCLELYSLADFHCSEELKSLSFSAIQEQFPGLGDEYINASYAVNMLSSHQKVETLMPVKEEKKKQNDKHFLVDEELERLLSKKFIEELFE